VSRAAESTGKVAGGWVLPAAEKVPSRMVFENDYERIEVLMGAIAKLQPAITKQLEVFIQTKV
jgi:hypothetical protein